MNYYNENNRFAVEWLRQLIKDGLISDGIVDDRSIVDVNPHDLKDFTQCHFFAGIGGWSYALRLANWPDDKPVWTGSCPCQPFSCAGLQKGVLDERHLWPDFFRLIQVCTPPIIFGEQVAGELGRAWLANVFTDLESSGYSVAGANLCAASVGAPHIRQRLYWVGDATFEPKRESALQTYSIATCGQTRTVTIAAMANQWPTPTANRRSGLQSHGVNGNSWSFEPDMGRVVNGVSPRVVAPYLSGYGNAIVPQVAAQFIRATSQH